MALSRPSRPLPVANRGRTGPANGITPARIAGPAIGAILALAGCAAAPGASHQPAPQRTGTVLTARRPAPTCRLSVLRIRAGREGENETALGGVEFTNTGSRACTLHGVPRVALILHGRRLPVRPTGPPPGIRGGYHVPSPVTLAPGKRGAAHLYTDWANWCGRHVRTLSIRIAMPGTGTVTVAFNGPPGWDYTPQCVQPGQPSTIALIAAYTTH
ncbi:MAG TPA: DUF4232 domain-containing protein [Streptosporangiaceae bacterium]|nr:DUF4232 domain-containing protein [Streptosporangiaceae bacterium]